MVTTEITTAKQLYEVSADFREFLRIWDEDRRAPFCLPDFLMEHGLHTQAACAMWAANEPDRVTYGPNKVIGERETPCGPYPTTTSSESENPAWMWIGGIAYCCSVRELPPEGAPLISIITESTPIAVILELMDIWHTRKESK